MIRLVAISGVVVLLIGAIGWALAARWSAEWTGSVLVFGAGLNLAACWMSFVPIVLVQRTHREYIPQAALGATVIRLLTVAAGTLAALSFGWWPMWPLSIWIVLFYLVLLIVETAVIVRLVAKTFSKTDSIVAV